MPGDTPRRPFLPGERVQFEPDHRSFGRFILSDQMRDPVAAVARDIALHAKANAPRGKGGTHHADAFEVKEEAGTMVVGKDYPAPRVMVEVFNSDPVALYNEFGNARTKRHRTLGRAGAAFGDFKPEGGPS